jgi:hypothetical protein
MKGGKKEGYALRACYANDAPHGLHLSNRCAGNVESSLLKLMLLGLLRSVPNAEVKSKKTITSEFMTALAVVTKQTEM